MNTPETEPLPGTAFPYVYISRKKNVIHRINFRQTWNKRLVSISAFPQIWSFCPFKICLLSIHLWSITTRGIKAATLPKSPQCLLQPYYNRKEACMIMVIEIIFLPQASLEQIWGLQSSRPVTTDVPNLTHILTVWNLWNFDCSDPLIK